MSTSKTRRRTVAASAGLIVAALLLWSYCGQGPRELPPVAEPTRPEPEPAPLAEEFEELAPVAPFAGEPAEELAAAALIPAAVPVVEPEPVVPEPEPVVPVAAPAPIPAEVAQPLSVPRPAVSAAPPETPPEEDLLIADSASQRFTPDVAAISVGGLDVGAPIQGDESALDVLQPCDLAASGCGAGLAPGQVIGTANDWSGFVLPGF